MTRMRYARTPAACAAVLLLALLAGCSGSSRGPNEVRLDAAAEASMAPVPTVTPAGRVVTLPSQPEGLAFDPQTGTLAAAVFKPGRVLLLDASSLEVRAEVPTPGDPARQRHLSLAGPGGPLLVADEGGDVLLQVSLPDGDVLSTTQVGDWPHGADVASDGSIWVGDEGVRTGVASVTVVKDGQVVTTLKENIAQPGAVLASGDRVGIVDVRRNSVSVYEVADRSFVASLAAGEGPTHGVVDRRGRLVVVDTEGGEVFVYEVRPRFVLTQRAPLPGSPYGVAYDPRRDQLIATLTATNEVVVLSLDTPQPEVVQRYPTVRQPNTVAVDPETGTLYVAGSTDAAELQIIERPEAGPSS